MEKKIPQYHNIPPFPLSVVRPAARLSCDENEEKGTRPDHAEKLHLYICNRAQQKREAALRRTKRTTSVLGLCVSDTSL